MCTIKIVLQYECMALMCVYDSHLSSVVVILQLAEAGGLQALPHAAQLRMQ